MPNIKISNLSVMTSAASGDLIPIVDVSDLTMAATGTTKRVTQAVLSSSILASAQPLDATLTALAGLTIAANSLTLGTGADAFTQHTFIANTLPARASTGSLESKPITDFGLSLIDDAAASNARTTLGLGTIATQAASSVAITGGTINSATVGATTPATGGFTSLSASTGASVTSSATNTNGLLVTGGSSLGSAQIQSGEIKLGSSATDYGLISYNNQAGLVTLKNNYSAGEVHITAGTATVLEAEPAGLKAVAATTGGYGLVVTGGSPLNAPNANSANIRLGTHATDYCYLDYNGSSANLVIGNNYSIGRISILTGATDRLTVLSTGNVGIGTTSPSYQLHVNTDSAGKPGVGGLWTVVSDERIKTDIVPADLSRCYDIVKQVGLKHFGFKTGVYSDEQINDKHSLGWIAQDVQKVFGKAVSIKPFTLQTDIPDGTEEYEEQEFTVETVNKVETSIQVINGKPVQASKTTQVEEKTLLFDEVVVVDVAGDIVMVDGAPLTHKVPRMVTKTRPKVRREVIEDCLDLNGGQMNAALYGAVQCLMAKVEAQAVTIASLQRNV